MLGLWDVVVAFLHAKMPDDEKTHDLGSTTRKHLFQLYTKIHSADVLRKFLNIAKNTVTLANSGFGLPVEKIDTGNTKKSLWVLVKKKRMIACATMILLC